MIEVTEFTPTQDACTATLYSTLGTGESYTGPIHVGYYVDTDEVWVECESKRVNIPCQNLAEFIKQLKRAAKLATKEPTA